MKLNKSSKKFISIFLIIVIFPAYLMQVLANMTTSVGPILGRDVSGKYAWAKSSFVMSSGKLIMGGITDPHLPITYYLIANGNKFVESQRCLYE